MTSLIVSHVSIVAAAMSSGNSDNSGYSSATLSLAASESAEHLNPAMSSLYADMSTRSVIVEAVGAEDDVEEVRGGYRAVKSKIVHFVRHGQGFHNMIADKYREAGREWEQYKSDDRNPYVAREVYDAPLTQVGREQAEELRGRSEKLVPAVEVVFTSPMCRAVQTAMIAFRHLLCADDAKGSRGRFIAVEDCREECGVHVCDGRRTVTSAKFEFPHVDFSGLETDDDAMFEGMEGREDKAALGERIRSFLGYLSRRPEGTVAVATHSGWLMTLFNGVLVCRGEGMKEWFMTGEMRTVKLVWRERV